MATSITERPYQYSFSKNEVKYVLAVTDPTTAGCAVDIEIYTHAVNATGTGTLLTSFTLYPNPDGIILCHVADYLRSKLSISLPTPQGAVVQAAGSQIQTYYIRYRQVTTANPNPAWTTDVTNKRNILIGGIEKMKYKGSNFFTSYLANNKPFLTWIPNNRFVFVDQMHFLMLLLITPAASITVNIKTVFTDLTENNSTATAVTNDHLLFHVKAGAQALALDAIDPTKMIYYYEISVVDGSTVLANPYRFYINYDHYYTWWDFQYSNSLGGIDSVRVVGEVTQSLEISNDDTERITGNDPINTIVPGEQFGETNIVKKDLYKGDAGWSKTAAQQDALTELLISRARYEWIDGRWIRVLNLKKSYDLRTTTDTKWSFPVEWKYAYEDEVYTPKGITI